MFPNPSREAGAKVEFLFQSCKLSVKFILGNFNPPNSTKPPNPQRTPPLAGRKGKTFFCLRQAFPEIFFSTFSRQTAMQLQRTSPSMRVQKYTLFSHMQAFGGSFFARKGTFPINAWKPTRWAGNFFSPFRKDPASRGDAPGRKGARGAHSPSRRHAIPASHRHPGRWPEASAVPGRDYSTRQIKALTLLKNII